MINEFYNLIERKYLLVCHVKHVYKTDEKKVLKIESFVLTIF